MINECEDKLICDFAETYHILNYKELSPALAATLLIGLRDDSRVKMHLSGSKVTLDQALLAIISDCLRFIAWTKTRDAKKGRRYKNKQIYDALVREDNKDDELMRFETVEEYEEYMQQRKEVRNG